MLNLVHELTYNVNACVDRAKADFIRQNLKQNAGNPEKCWQSMNTLIKDNVETDINNIAFHDPTLNDMISKENIPCFFNSFFATIVDSF